MDIDREDSLAWSGLLACHKPQGVTSRDCVNQVVRLLRQVFPKPSAIPKVGHAGTLDPLATGVLVIGIGAGVRLVPYIQQMPKVYDATFRLGCWSSTIDIESELFACEETRVPSREEIEAAAESLIGQIEQTPPSTSAIKVNGKKAYKYAHQGIAVTVPPRMVHIESIEITRYDYPEVDAIIECGSGTYIRTLGDDMAKACGSRAVMSRLLRSRIGVFCLSDCHEVSSLTSESLQASLLPLAMGVAQLPQLELTPAEVDRVTQGGKLDCSGIDAVLPNSVDEAKVLDGDGVLRAIVQRRNQLWCPYRVFHRATG